MNKQVAFYIMTYKGYLVLKNFVEEFAANAIELVVIGKDGSVENDYSEEIKHLCESNHIPYFYRNQKYNIKSKIIFTISWRWMLKLEQKIIILHDSLLPKYRGFAPLVNCLINNEKETGVTALYANDDYDCGDIIAQKSVKITYPITIDDAIELISPLYSELVNSIAKKYFSDEEIIAYQQNENEATYSLWRDDEDYAIHWNDSASNIKRFIDAVGFPYKGASSVVDNQIVRIKNATILEDLKIENRDVGKVIFFRENCPVVVCKEGLLRLDLVEDENNNKVKFQKFRLRFK
jgi:methionyl-tRNA formyltransferase